EAIDITEKSTDKPSQTSRTSSFVFCEKVCRGWAPGERVDSAGARSARHHPFSSRGRPVVAKRLRRRIRGGPLLGAVAMIAVVSRPAVHLIHTAWRDGDERAETPAGFVDDASRLNETAVAEVWPVLADADDAEAQLAALLTRANRDGLPVSIAGARHS